MCRSIHTLYHLNPPTSSEEIEAAALQYIRKVSGFQKPSKANQAVFEQAVADLASLTEKLLAELHTPAPRRERAALAAKARRSAAARQAASAVKVQDD